MGHTDSTTAAVSTTIADSTLDALGRWYQDQRGMDRSWRTARGRVETLYRTLSAWYGPGIVECYLLVDPTGSLLRQLVTITTNSHFDWSACKCRTPLERRSVMLGGTTAAGGRKVLSWAVPARPLDPSVGRNLTWRGEELRAPSEGSGSLARREYEARKAA